MRERRRVKYAIIIGASLILAISMGAYAYAYLTGFWQVSKIEGTVEAVEVCVTYGSINFEDMTPLTDFMGLCNASIIINQDEGMNFTQLHAVFPEYVDNNGYSYWMPAAFRDLFINFTLWNSTGHAICHGMVRIVKDGELDLHFEYFWSIYGQDQYVVRWTTRSYVRESTSTWAFIVIAQWEPEVYLPKGDYVFNIVFYGTTGAPSSDVSWWCDIWIELVAP